MIIKDYKCKCGHDDFFFADKGNQKGIYCSYCGQWLKWADKNEQNLIMKQEPIIDKIRAEIEHVIDYTYDSTDYDKALYNGAYKDGLYEALDIIDKYKAESEEV